MTFKRIMESSVITSSQPMSVAVGDFNNDDQIDIVVANSGTNTIGIFLSNSDGTFANQQTYPTGSESSPSSIVVNDFNNDNYLDIAVADYGTHNIGIFLGNGNGTFTNQAVFFLGSSRPLFITTGDFNNDNRTDIVVANEGTDNIGILLGNGDGTLQMQTTYFTGYDSLPYSLAVGHFNKDNQLDIAVANYGTNNIGIFLGSGNGTFASQKTYTTTYNSNPSSIAVGDFNNDKQLDIVVANYGTSNIGIFLNRGNGTFADQTTYSTGAGSRPQFINVGYFNGNNYLDVVIVDSENDWVSILPGCGNGSFSAVTTYDATSGSSPFSITVTNINNNNQSDIIIANYGTNNVLVLSGYSSNPSAREMNYLIESNSRPSSVAVGDFNNDTYLDVVVNKFNGNSIVIFAGHENKTLTNEMTYSTGIGSAPQYVIVADLNNDKQLDIATANLGSGSIGVLLGFGNGTFTPVTNYLINNSSMPFAITAGDVNNDRQLDLITANYVTNDVAVFLGYGNGTFANVMTYSCGDNSLPLSVAVGDVNNDNRLDIVTANYGSGSVGVLLGYGNGTFATIMSYSTGSNSQPTSIVLADFNNDNRLDIAVANSEACNVGILLGCGNGTFGEQSTYLTGSASLPYVVTVTDYNNDSQYDLAVSEIGGDEVVIFFGYGNGSFVLARTYPVDSGSAPYGLTVADMNNDNQLEIVVAFWGSGKMGVLTEYYAAEFAYQIQYSTGSAPLSYSVAVSDFNSDNWTDIVVANSGTNNIDVLFGLGNDMFRTQTIDLNGTDFYPQYVTTGDINKDNNKDIVTANSKNDSISVILGYGNGTFAPQTIYSTGSGSDPYAVIIRDLNNDNRSDFIIANAGTDNIGIFFGFDYRSFQTEKPYSSADHFGPYAIVVNDFNNDHYVDIAVVFETSGYLSILLGYGNGSFANMISVSTGNGSKPHGVTASDFNNDGRMDIALANYGTSNIGIFLGYGNGSFASTMTYSTGNGSTPYHLDVGDFNNDGQMDIVVVNYGTNNIGIFLGYGNGSFATMMTFSTGKGSTPYYVDVGDFNNDTRMDIVVATCNTNGVAVLLGYGNGSFATQVTYSTGLYSQPFSVTIGDFNNDNQLDIATANNNLNNVGILLGYGNGTFGALMEYSTGAGSAPFCVGVGDFNNDDKLDIAVVNQLSSNVVVLFGLGDGSFLLGMAYSTGIGSGPSALAIDDFNNDSRLDIAVTNPMLNNTAVFLGYGIEPFADVVTVPTGDGSQPYSVAVSDFNSDGQSDIVVANYGTNNIGILFGYSNGNFDAMITYPTGDNSAPYTVAIGDFNRDNHSDIIVTNSGTDNIAILLGYGNGTFAIAATYITGDRSRPYSVSINDFNNDDIPDIAVANSGTNNILLFYGYGNGTFGNVTSYALGYGFHPYSIASADLNRDGSMDIVIACYNTDNIVILVKMC